MLPEARGHATTGEGRCCHRCPPMLPSRGLLQPTSVFGTTLSLCYKPPGDGVLTMADSGASRGRRRCYRRLTAMLHPSGGGATKGPCRCYVRQAPVLPKTHGSATSDRRWCYICGRRRRGLSPEPTDGGAGYGAWYELQAYYGLRCHRVLYFLFGGDFCRTVKGEREETVMYTCQAIGAGDRNSRSPGGRSARPYHKAPTRHSKPKQFPMAAPPPISGDLPLPTAALLAHNHSPSDPAPQPAASSRLLIFLTAALAVSTSYLLLLRAPSPTVSAHAAVSVSRPLSKLQKPVVLLISTDGFRFGYQYKARNPHLRRLIANGTSAVEGLIPVFPTLTFPNHYSIVTGLYPSSHGIINNFFPDPISGDQFTMGSHEPKWWLGEPLWVTAADQGVQAATFFWPGSEVKKGAWDCPEKYCRHYNESVPFEERVDAILGYFDLPADEMPQLLTLYFEDPDHQGHQVGPDDPAITDAVEHIDELMGKLIAGLEARGVFEDVNIIWVGDHGMVGTCDQKLVFLEDLAPWIVVESDWVLSTTPLLAIRPPDGVSPAEVVAKMNEGLGSGKVKNGEHLKVYLKEDLPSRLHYSENYRIPPIIGLVDEGYKVEKKQSNIRECGGAHGYDNAFFSMRTMFAAHGPRFEGGKTVPSFENVQIYNVIASILNLRPASNNGSASFPGTVLLPSE